MVWLMGMLSIPSIRCNEFLTLKVYGSGTCISMSLENNWANLCAGAFHQSTMGLMGVPFLWIFSRPFKVGAVGLRLMYFHLSSFWIVWLQRLTVFLISF